MDKNKLIELLKDAWNDGMSQYHDCKHSSEYKTDLENWLETNEDDINDLCGGKKPDASANTLPIDSVRKRICKKPETTICYLKPCYVNCDDCNHYKYDS